MIKQYQLRDYKFKLVFFVVTLTILGIFVIGSARDTSSFMKRQILGLMIGLIVMVIVSLIDYSSILNFYWILYFLNIILLLLVHQFGVNVNNATRWFKIAGIQFQPSELTKLVLILFYAKYITKHQEEINKPVTILKMFLLLLPPLILIYKQPDLSTTIAIFGIFCVLLFIGGLSYKIIGATLGVTIPVAVIFLSIVMQPGQNLLNDYQHDRIMAWLNPEKYATSTGYQQINSIMAIGSGQLFGKGLKNDDITSVKNGNYISEPQTDFIFAIVGEELGFVGCCIVIILLAIIVLQCLWVARSAKDLAGQIIASGVAALFCFQSFINMSVATGLMPNTGIPLPFVSYGLTSLVCAFIGVGLVLNVGLQKRKY